MAFHMLQIGGHLNNDQQLLKLVHNRSMMNGSQVKRRNKYIIIIIK